MKDRIIELDKQMLALEKEKKNFARRINYKLKKLKDEKSKLLEEKPDTIPQEPFELVRENAEYQVWAEKKWVAHEFLDLVPGHCFRVWVDGKAKDIGGGKVLEACSKPYTNHQHRHSIKVCHSAPPRSIQEEIRLRTEPRHQPSSSSS